MSFLGAGFEFLIYNQSFFIISDLFPDPRTLNKHLENYKCGPGPQEDAFHLLKMKESMFSEKGRYVVIKFDEIHLKEAMEYDPTNKCLSGTITMPMHSDPTIYEGKLFRFLIKGSKAAKNLFVLN